MKRLLLLAALLGSTAHAYNLAAPILPDPSITPGDVLTSDPKVICVPGYTKTVRNVPQSVKEQVYRNYGITSRQSGEYEVDHLISLELGGSNDIKNLWPESFQTQPLNAHVKDKIENALHDLACNGQITFQQARQAIATNWEQAYRDYLGPLPGGVAVQQPAPGSARNGMGNPSPAVPTATAPVSQQGQSTLPAIPSTPASQTRQPTTTVSGKVQPLSGGVCPPSAPIKVSRSGIYHLPTGDSNYNRTKAVACFATTSAAQAAGYRGVK